MGCERLRQWAWVCAIALATIYQRAPVIGLSCGRAASCRSPRQPAQHTRVLAMRMYVDDPYTYGGYAVTRRLLLLTRSLMEGSRRA